MPTFTFKLAGHGPLSFDISQLIIAGWTGRDSAMVEHHIAELEAIGVARPKNVPTFYRVAAALLCSDGAIEVAGGESSGEAECVLFSTEYGLLVGIGSDHTDRKVERYGVTVSKQMCGKPVGAELWAYADVASHWDQLRMRSWRVRDGVSELYQDGPVTRMLAPEDLILRYTGAPHLPVGSAMFCGTQPVIGDLGFGDAFELELYDPVLQRRLHHRYAVQPLPVEG
ncbi:DUF2848 domain-containing protein [Janthinobacterium agaricidamnosum]|uniref:Dihydroorotate dehydrogenase n=1 Tax=Janthinobacterium agaricidamnosum NBRC 102515 = DSM 9628 TaxID=1349767 RepID=W0VAU6_9BURK|nr:DUF2848 domain-containing protein [Janthinobacterium agaricidamnosum]CDG84991.1 dihydroorotate dehydrogenase [Janthinobacterium agaricidamnosum NBRC 102515 = DSM 9628]